MIFAKSSRETPEEKMQPIVSFNEIWSKFKIKIVHLLLAGNTRYLFTERSIPCFYWHNRPINLDFQI